MIREKSNYCGNLLKLKTIAGNSQFHLTETRLKPERDFSRAEIYPKLDEEVSGRFP